MTRLALASSKSPFVVHFLVHVFLSRVVAVWVKGSMLAVFCYAHCSALLHSIEFVICISSLLFLDCMGQHTAPKTPLVLQ